MGSAPRQQPDRAAQDSPDDLIPVVLYAHGAEALAGRQGPNFLILHPCDTFRVFRFQVRASCSGCLMQWEVSPHGLLGDSPLAHRPWPVVMAQLPCPRCACRPDELRFMAGSGGDVGAISTRTELVLHVSHGSAGLSKPLVSRVGPDPFAQHDDGGAG